MIFGDEVELIHESLQDNYDRIVRWTILDRCPKNETTKLDIIGWHIRLDLDAAFVVRYYNICYQPD